MIHDNAPGNDADESFQLPPRRTINAQIAIHQAELVTRYLNGLYAAVHDEQCTYPTWRTRDASLRSWLSYLDTVAKTDTPNTDTLQAYAAWLKDTTQRHYAPATINTYLEAVQAFARWCSQPEQPVAIEKASYTRDTPIPAITPELLAHLLEHIPHTTPRECRDRVIMLMLYYTMCESISLHRANIDDIDFQTKRWMHQPRGHRAKDQASNLPEAVIAELRRYLAWRPNARPGDPLLVAMGTNHLHDGCRQSTLGMRLAVRKIMHRAGLTMPAPDTSKTSTKRLGTTSLRTGGQLVFAPPTTRRFANRLARAHWLIRAV